MKILFWLCGTVDDGGFCAILYKRRYIAKDCAEEGVGCVCMEDRISLFRLNLDECVWSLIRSGRGKGGRNQVGGVKSDQRPSHSLMTACYSLGCDNRL